MEEERKQTIISAHCLRVDRFDRARPYCHGMKISHDQTVEHRALETKIGLHVFSRSVMEHNLPAKAQQ